MFIEAVREDDHRLLRNRRGHALKLPALPAAFACAVRADTLGTKFEVPAGEKLNRTEVPAAHLGELGRPTIVIDTQRNGCGAHSSWSPEQFATRIPAALDRRHSSRESASV